LACLQELDAQPHLPSLCEARYSNYYKIAAPHLDWLEERIAALKDVAEMSARTIESLRIKRGP
jgi:hypothetical protein